MIKLLSALTPLNKQDKEFKRKLKNILGFSPNNIALYKQAFRHSSSSKEITEHLQSNERLEFLGDAVLGLAVAHNLFERMPDLRPGDRQVDGQPGAPERLEVSGQQRRPDPARRQRQ